MPNRHTIDRAVQGGNDAAGIDPEDFARRLRAFAVDAYRGLGRPDGPIDEMIALHRRAWDLSHLVPGARMTEIRRWLLAARLKIGTRLQRWAEEESRLVHFLPLYDATG